MLPLKNRFFNAAMNVIVNPTEALQPELLSIVK